MTLVAHVIPNLRCHCGCTLMEHGSAGNYWLQCLNRQCEYHGKRYRCSREMVVLTELPKDAVA